MNRDLTYRLAEAEDAPRIMEIIAQAKAQMQAAGSDQWQQGYPALQHIEADIAGQCGWVLEQQMLGVVAYGAVIFAPEPAYTVIDGRWLSEREYVVVHRLAVAELAKRRGVATEFMRRTESLALGHGIKSFRVDTNFDNRHMLHMLAGLGFTHCGECNYESGLRMVFEKLLGERL